MTKSNAIELTIDELSLVQAYAKNQARNWQQNEFTADENDIKVIETCKKINELILCNASAKFILMDKPF